MSYPTSWRLWKRIISHQFLFPLLLFSFILFLSGVPSVSHTAKSKARELIKKTVCSCLFFTVSFRPADTSNRKEKKINQKPELGKKESRNWEEIHQEIWWQIRGLEPRPPHLYSGPQALCPLTRGERIVGLWACQEERRKALGWPNKVAQKDKQRIYVNYLCEFLFSTFISLI